MRRKRVAVVGYSFRLPGTDSDGFWPGLLTGRNFVTEIAPERWARDAFLHPRKSHPGTSYTAAAGSVGDVSAFDAAFFGISPREAAQMDPQQRLLLELSWEAFENAGVKPSDIRGSHCGVYIGISTNDYSLRLADDLSAVDASAATGTSSCIAANRISYVFDLRGPSLALDTACSSSLVAFHLACRSILSEECTQAIAGGVSLHTHPYGFVTFAKASMLSCEGACKVFDASGDGYVRSEGGAVFFLKEYERALADGNPILAVIAGSVVNSDGKTPGLTVPSIGAQVELLQRAYSEAGIAPSQIDYIEAHGTGTAVGDPVETHALGVALGQFRPKDSPLLIGSVKSNLGHLEAAAGAAGLVKALHCIQHRAVPPNIHFNHPNPNIRFDEWNLRVVTEVAPLDAQSKLVIGINSFGFGGANAHVILESPGIRPDGQPNGASSAPLPVMVSGKNAAALRAAARELSHFVRTPDHSTLYDIGYSAAFHREWHEHRAIVLASTKDSLAADLKRFSEDENTAPSVLIESGTALASPAGPAFIYSGNGAVWEGMGQRLMAGDPAFRSAVLEVDEIFRRWADFSLQDQLTGRSGPGRYEYAEIVQPALFALQVGITQTLRQRGITPTVIAGHSVGEVAAAWASGALSLEQAVLVVYHRSRLQGTTKGKGQMTAVALGEAAAQKLLEQTGLSGVVSIAAVNASNSVTVAGPSPALVELEQLLVRRNITHRRLALDYPFHSPAMDVIEKDLIEALADLTPSDTHIPFHSGVTGERLEGAALDAGYWWRNIREPVQFEKAVKSLLAQPVNILAEVGPHPLLRGYLATCLRDRDIQGRIIPTLLRDDDSPGRIAGAACQIAIAGAHVDWNAHFPHRGRFVRLPNYPWQRERHWHAVSPESYQRLNRNRVHPLLGYRLHEIEWGWESHVDTQLCPTLADHVIGEAIVMPGTAYVEMALAAARLWQERAIVEIEQLEIRSPLILGDAQSRALRFSIDASDGSFSIKSRDYLNGPEWTEHAVGRIVPDPGALPPPAPLTLPNRAPDFTGADHDELTAAVGLNYGPAFRAIDAVWAENGSVYARLRVPPAIESELKQMQLHPALLDCTFQLIIQMLKNDYVARAGTVYVPSRIDALLYRPGRTPPSLARATLRRSGPHSIAASFALFDADGALVAWIREAQFSSLPLRRNPSDRLRYLESRSVPMPHPSAPAGAPRQLFDHLQRTLGDVTASRPARSALKRYTHEIEPLLDTLCSGFAAQALRSLAGRGDVLTQVQACAEANPDTVPLLRHIIAMLEEDKLISADGSDWRFLPSLDRPAPEDIWNCLIADYPDYVRILHAVGRVGMHLPELLSGRATLEQILPRECTLSHLTHHLLADAGRHGLERAVRDVIAQALGECPADKRLRIIELSAAQPMFAAAICKALDFDRCDYVYATPSPVPEDCQRLVEKYPAAEVRRLDSGMDADPAARAASDQFQLALVTSDFATENEALLALAYAKSHLAPGASILVIEQHPSRWSDLVFGGQRSWWSVAPDGSWSSRQKPAAHWRQQLLKLGFQPSTTLGLSPDSSSGPYLLLSRLPEQIRVLPQRPLSANRNWVVLADKEGFSAGLAAQLAKALEARGDRVIRVTPGSRWSALDERHYEIAPHDPAHYEALLSQLGQNFTQLDGIVHLYGLGSSAPESTPLLLVDRQIDRCAAVTGLTRACDAAGIKTTCWLVTARATSPGRASHGRQDTGTILSDSIDAALWGFGRTLMNESASAAVRLVDIDDSAALETLAYGVARELFSPDAEQEVMLNASGERYVPRLHFAPRPAGKRRADATPEQATARLGLRARGQLAHLQWETHVRMAPGDDDLEIEVQATGLNFRDVMYALGLLTDDALEGGFAGPALGLEFAGIVTDVGRRVQGFAPGNRVLGFAPASFSDRVVTKADCVCHIPPALDFEAAATIPSAFLTAYYALNQLARLEEGEKILIHGAAGGVGIAAIQLAKLRGAEIFATAGSEEKRDFLRLLGVNHVFDSRTLAFSAGILAITEGGGVDVVLNSLAGEAINRNLRVLKPFGRFLELGKRDFQQNTRIGLRPFRNNISYFGIDVDQLMKERPDLTRRLFGEVMALFGEGALHPLPYQRFEAEEIVSAFRYMQQSRHIGKIVVTYQNGVRPAHVPEDDRRALRLPPDASYLVTGGLSGFGLKTAQWLVSRGARHLVLVSRSGVTTPEAQAVIAQLANEGVTVRAEACDVSDLKAISSLLSEVAVTLPPLRGIVHAAAVIDDGLIQNMNREQIRRVFAPKILGAYYLHQLTLGKPLDFFILFSSATTLFGNPGQGNYVAANNCLEALAARRRAAGLPALCIGWGVIDDVGYLARNPQIKEALQARMGGSATPSSVALAALEELLLADRSGVGVLELDWKALTRFLPTAGTPRFGELVRQVEDGKADDVGITDVKRLLTTLSGPPLLAAFSDMLKTDVAGILRMPPEKIDENRSLYELGFDSLMGVELSTAVDLRFGVRLPVMALSENPTIAGLSERLLSQLSSTDQSSESATETEAAELALEIATQHADDANAHVIAAVAARIQAEEPGPATRIIH